MAKKTGEAKTRCPFRNRLAKDMFADAVRLIEAASAVEADKVRIECVGRGLGGKDAIVLSHSVYEKACAACEKLKSLETLNRRGDDIEIVSDPNTYTVPGRGGKATILPGDKETLREFKAVASLFQEG